MTWYYFLNGHKPAIAQTHSQVPLTNGRTMQPEKAMLKFNRVTTVTYTFEDVLPMPLVIIMEQEAQYYHCQYGHKLYTGNESDVNKAVLHILYAMQDELQEAIKRAESKS